MILCTSPEEFGLPTGVECPTSYVLFVSEQIMSAFIPQVAILSLCVYSSLRRARMQSNTIYIIYIHCIYIYIFI